MADVNLITRGWLKGSTTNSTNTGSYPTRVATYQDPANTNPFVICPTSPTAKGPVSDGLSPLWLQLLPYGDSVATEAFVMKVIGWRQARAGVSSQGLPLWAYQTMGEFTCTLGGSTGVTGTPVDGSQLFCDTIVPVAASFWQRVLADGTIVGSDVFISSPTGNGYAGIRMPMMGMERIEFLFKTSVGTPGTNLLISFY